MTYKQAIKKIRKNQGTAYDFAEYVYAPDLDIDDIVTYLKILAAGSVDASIIFKEVQERIDSCGFDANTEQQVIDALGLDAYSK